MLRAILNEYWRQHPTKQQLYDHQPPITKTIKIRWTRHVGHSWRSRDKLISDVFLWTPSHGRAKAGRPAQTYVQLKLTYSSSVLIGDVALRTCWKQWTIGRYGERGSEISMLIAQHNDDDNNWFLRKILYSCWLHICSYIAFLCASHQAYFLCILLASMWCIHIVVLTQPQVVKNPVLFYQID